ncbi:MAG TPA: hypothetical protein VNF45_05085 [Candidatus Binataceae bacterium]|nr:hypothetical protein [Candidatus Binataceae bacterium]
MQLSNSRRAGLGVLGAMTIILISTLSAALAQTWRSVGPDPIAGAYATFGSAQITTPTYNAAGRVTAIAPDPTVAGRIFVGTANGGLWMITTAKSSPVFKRISDTFPNPTQAIGAIALDTSTSPPTIYVGTGEANHGTDNYYGRGLFASINPEATTPTWTEVLASSDFSPFQAFTSLAFANILGTKYLFAGIGKGASVNRAGSFKEQGNPTQFGLWRVTLGTSPFSTQLSVKAAGLEGACTTDGSAIHPCPATDVVALPNGSGGTNLFAALDGFAVTAGSSQGGVYLSTDAGNTWTPVLTTNTCPGLSACPSGIGRIKLAGAGSTLYAMVGSNSLGSYTGFYASQNAGAGMTWSAGAVPCATLQAEVLDGTASGANTSSAGPGTSCGPSTASQSSYDQAMAVSPTSPATVWFGGLGLYQSTDGGATWNFLEPGGSAGSYHTDQHALVLDPFDSTDSTLYVGNDGGLFLDRSGVFSDINSGPTGGLKSGQMYGVSISPAQPPGLLGGLQDNGALHFNTGNLTIVPPDLSWNTTGVGDVGVIPLAPNDSNYAFHAASGNPMLPFLFYSNAGGISGSWNDASEEIRAALNDELDSVVFLPPIAVSPNPATPHRILFGGHFVYAVGFGTGTPVVSVQSSAAATPASCPNNMADCAIQDIEFDPSGTNAWAISANAPTPSDPTVNTGYQVSCTTQADLDSGAVWMNATKNLPSSGIPTGIAISPIPLPGGPYPVYVTMFAQAGSTAPANTIFESVSGCMGTVNGGTPWIALPTVPTHLATGEPLSVLRLLVDNQDPTGQTLWAGTDIGVFNSKNVGISWTNSGAQQVPPLPRVPVMDIAENTAGDIAIATHGSGAYLMTPTPTPTPTATPTPPSFGSVINSEQGGDPCPRNPCTVTFGTPLGAQPGDLFLLALSATDALDYVPSVPQGWTILPFVNQSGSQNFQSSDAAGHREVAWLLAYKYGTLNPEPAQYSFSENVSLTGINGDEFGGLLLRYVFANTSSLNYSAWGFGSTTDNQWVDTGTIPAPADQELVVVFKNLADDTNGSEDASGVSFGFPYSTNGDFLTIETPQTITGDFWTGFAGDTYTYGGGGSFGYSTEASPLSTIALPLSWMVLLPPAN